MSTKKIILSGISTVILGYPLIMLLTIVFSMSSGDGPVTAAAYNTGITAIVLSILLLCAVVIMCTLFLLREIRK